MKNGNDQKDNPMAFFDTISSLYDEIRPPYPKDVFVIIQQFLKSNRKTYRFLEIGAGNGLASSPIHKFWSSDLTLVEPGIHFYKLLKNRFGSHPNIQLVNDYFETAKWEAQSFDAIFSATAFHWLDKDLKFRKTYQLLKENGLLIVFWNSYWIADEKLFSKIQKVYGKYARRIESNYLHQIRQKKWEARKDEFINNGFFNLKMEKSFSQTLHYTGTEYVKLLKTFPDHSSFPDSFFNEVIQTIENHENIATVEIMTYLLIGQKSAMR